MVRSGKERREEPVHAHPSPSTTNKRCLADRRIDSNKFVKNGGSTPETAKPEMICEKCKKPMIIRNGKRGQFFGCTGFPGCTNTKSINAQSNR